MTTPPSLPAAIVVMGVSGSGKTVVGRRLAKRLGWRFLDADDVHPAANVQKMASGVPLDDADREPWLARLASELADAIARGQPVVLACSALKRAYRGQLGLPDPAIRLVHLDGPREVLRKRAEQRAGHFMPATLLDSQLATLEPPGAAESPIVIDVSAPPEAIVEQITAALRLP
jgi:carbohydrate kinase (thermoresistant glucokinase family)